MKYDLHQIIKMKYRSKAEFAKHIGVSRWTIYNWIQDPKVIRLKHWQKISSTTGIPLHDLI